jgi:putative selenate reductase
MSDRFSIIPLRQLLSIIFRHIDQAQLFGIPEALFFRPKPSDPFTHYRYGQLLETPIGVAAGPHTQMAQNIVVAWLCGARFMELKTVQTLDELDVSKPCIDMQDEGYNCEWSQELKISESFDQYLNAWILIHLLKDKLNIGQKTDPGFIFNMSVGYDFQGMQQDNVQWFFEKMGDASSELETKIDAIQDLYPKISSLGINSRLSDNITLSTMHGCPPQEIEKIGRYLLKEKKLHTAIKMNPTLLGKEELHQLLKQSGFETEVPDAAFEHDINFEDAVKTISSLREIARDEGLEFSLKLTNTLECINHKNIFPENEKMMYLSGRALHPISVKVAEKLQNEFHGELDLSFSAGADAFNTPELVASGLSPVTVCSDLLKPGGYGRLHQYIEELRRSFDKVKAESMDTYLLNKNGGKSNNLRTSAMANLANYADNSIQNEAYQKINIKDPSIKTSRPLGYFDCVHAPCVDTCPTNQAIPDYLYHTAKGDFKKASEVILKTNPFPHTTGMVCDHVCQLKCTRINYDQPVLIREIKRFIAEEGQSKLQTGNGAKMAGQSRPKAGIIGAGPSGLSCASFLAKAGFEVSVYESKPQAGGMVSGAIPSFRLKQEAIQTDIERIKTQGVSIHYTNKIEAEDYQRIQEGNDYLYIATGAQRSKQLNIIGAENSNVLDPITFLEDVKSGRLVNIGDIVVIIGAGNTAMDAARTAQRLVGIEGKVLIVYRRTKKQMPADVSEIKAVQNEGVEIFDLASPKMIKPENDGSILLVCSKMKLGKPDESGRPRPVEIAESAFEIHCDTIIPAIGQDLSIDFVDNELLRTKANSYETRIPNTYIGGDALRGAASIIEAIGDGRKAAQEIIDKAGIDFDTQQRDIRTELDLSTHLVNRAKRIPGLEVKNRTPDNQIDFELVSRTLSAEEAQAEAARCLLCDEICNTCIGVCPNLALHPYQAKKGEIHLQKIVALNGASSIEPDQRFEVSQVPQILHLADWCNECGNCTTFCPSVGTPYIDKPHYYFSKGAFDKASDGFYLDDKHKPVKLLRKIKGHSESLTELNGIWLYENASARISINPLDFKILDYTLLTQENIEIKFLKAAEMSIIFPAVLSLLGISKSTSHA